MRDVIRPQYKPHSTEDHTSNRPFSALVDTLLILAILSQGLSALVSMLVLFSGLSTGGIHVLPIIVWLR
jgi:hypothetical protein